MTQLIPKLAKIDQVYGDGAYLDDVEDGDKMPELNEIDLGDFPKDLKQKKKKKKRRKSYIDRNLLANKRKLDVNARD